MPLMSPAQQSAFDGANGSGHSAADVHTLVVSVLMVLMLLWLAWVAISAYQLLKTPGIKTPEAAGKVVRAAFIAMVTMAVANIVWGT
ncbi:MAG: TIGR03758 family integrating conjugative element protein [Halioglobus sp.]|nr:TIGR03758 family integrating conjugative element protein [Halioglobus sp.]|tara:strand:- start:3334 stop:3594 length:261 start_codon:yes stop_codon:yes gene_type:complete